MDFQNVFRHNQTLGKSSRTTQLYQTRNPSLFSIQIGTLNWLTFLVCESRSQSLSRNLLGLKCLFLLSFGFRYQKSEYMQSSSCSNLVLHPIIFPYHQVIPMHFQYSTIWYLTTKAHHFLTNWHYLPFLSQFFQTFSYLQSPW